MSRNGCAAEILRCSGCSGLCHVVSLAMLNMPLVSSPVVSGFVSRNSFFDICNCRRVLQVCRTSCKKKKSFVINVQCQSDGPFDLNPFLSAGMILPQSRRRFTARVRCSNSSNVRPVFLQFNDTVND
jgi:hypothetical protein